MNETKEFVVLSVKIRKRTSCGEKPSEGACSERDRVFHPGGLSSASHKSQVGEEVGFQVAAQHEGCGYKV